MPLLLDSPLAHQFALLLLLALPVACAAWTVTQEEVFRGPREFCKRLEIKEESVQIAVEQASLPAETPAAGAKAKR